MGKVIGFTGTSQGMTEAQRRAVGQLLAGLDAAEVRHGDCVGADAELHGLAKDAGIRVVIHPPTDPNKRAFCQADHTGPERPYLDRNHDFVDACDLLLAAPAEAKGETLRSGTWATVRYARKQGKPIIVVRPSGVLEPEGKAP